MSNKKFGFTRGRSTIDAGVELVQHIFGAWEDSRDAISIFCDLSKAFDCVDHETLIGKLRHYGVTGRALDLLKSNLSNRVQRVDVNVRNQELEFVNSTVFLGITLDDRLQWGPHISKLAKRLSSAAYAVKKMRNLSDVETGRLVNDIVIPKRFRGVQTNFQDDIAIVYLSKPFDFNEYVRPVCVDFDLKLDRTQLTAGNLGKIAGWGFIDEDGHTSPELQVVRLPYVEIDQCIANSSPDFRAYITSDKICAGHTNGTALCKGDSGGGLVFVKEEGPLRRHYLRGVASTAANNDKKCNTHAVPTFTHILAHEHFIKDHLNFTNI
ncbi:Transmembrane protease serine 12 [Eumeta japonica]|uniref:Transmembrane protease serine 12 n=1 Tax=Eumeta variegata TaxID=151549 RepID=A0A4C1YMF2_EUMVA|nr:Transmembrane protease serine 12 [Eumeta japonica]